MAGITVLLYDHDALAGSLHRRSLTGVQPASRTGASSLIHALDKLAAEGSALPYPHSSAVQGADRLRELRLRAGEVFVVAAIGPEAQADKRGFGRAAAAAQARLDLIEEDQT